MGTSRSVLAERFQLLMGSSPMQYLTQWRMVLASSLLRRSNAQLTHIAQDVGYQTDTGFTRAFRREFGVPSGTGAETRRPAIRQPAWWSSSRLHAATRRLL